MNKGFLRRPVRTQMPEERTGRHHPAPGPRPTLDIFVDLKKKRNIHEANVSFKEMLKQKLVTVC